MKLVPGDGLKPSRPELDAGILISKSRYIRGSNFRYKKTSYKLVLLLNWCPETDLNRHDHKSRDFKSLVSTDFTTRAKIVMEAEPGVEPRWMDLQSTAWPLCHSAKTFGAVHETRTRDPDLGKVVLYQLS